MYYPRCGDGPGWDIAGTDEYDKEASFNKRVQRANTRLAGARTRALWGNTKANRVLYGVESESARFTLHEHADVREPGKVAKVLRQAAFLPMHVTTEG